MSEPAGWSLVTRSDSETRAVGEALGALLRGGDVVALSGELGAGKTTLVQGIVAGLGGGARVTSPTFTLINDYETRSGVRVVHVDAYRLGERVAVELDAETLGLDDLLDDPRAVVLVEWAERIAGSLPEERIDILLGYGSGEAERQLEMRARGPRSAGIVAALARALAHPT